MKLTEADLLRLLQSTKPNRNYHVERAARVLYLHHVEGLTHMEVAARMKISYSTVTSVILRAEDKLRACWPLFAQRDVNKLYTCESLARRVWPMFYRSGAASVHTTH